MTQQLTATLHQELPGVALPPNDALSAEGVGSIPVTHAPTCLSSKDRFVPLASIGVGGTLGCQ